MTNWEAVRKEWENSKITLIDLAEKHGVKEGTLKSRKSREGWKKVAQKKTAQKKDASENKKMQPSKKDATSNPPKKRSGNPNPPNQFTERNRASWIHGLESQYLHQEQVEIIKVFENRDIADKLWIQLEIKFSAIIRMQKIMWVNDEKDTLSDVSLRSDGDEGSMTGYKVAYAYERYESYIKAQARAMAEYRNLVDSFLKHASLDDERRLKLEQMQLSIDKTKVEIEKIGNDEQTGPIEIKIVGKKRD